MQIRLNTQTRNYLRKLRKKERDKKRYIKIAVILALDAGHSAQEVADILRPDEATIYRYATVYQNVGLADYLKQNRVPYAGKLTEEQREAIRAEVSSCLYTSAGAVADWIACRFGIHYHEKHVVKLLHRSKLIKEWFMARPHIISTTLHAPLFTQSKSNGLGLEVAQKGKNQFVLVQVF